MKVDPRAVFAGLLVLNAVAAQGGKSIAASLQVAETVAKVKVVEGLRVEVLRVYGDGDEALVGRTITLEPIPWNGKTGIALRACLSVTNLLGNNTPGSHWLMALKQHGQGETAVYRNPLGDGLLGARVRAENAALPKNDAAGAVLAELLAALDDPDAAVRESALTVLRGWDGPFFPKPGATLWRDEAIAARLLKLADDPADQVRWLLAWMIPTEAGDDGEAVLFRFLFDDARLVRQPAQSHLERRGHVDLVAAIKALHDYRLDEWTSTLMQRHLDRKMRPATITSNIAKMHGGDDERSRSQAAWMLGLQEPNPEITSGLIEALPDEEFEVRRWAAWSLGRVGGEGAAKALTTCSNDVHPLVRVQIGRSLVALGERRAGLELLRALATAGDARAAAQSIDALAQIGGIEALDALATAVRDKRAAIRAYAGAALPKFVGVAEHQVAALRGDLREDEHVLVRAAVR